MSTTVPAVKPSDNATSPAYNFFKLIRASGGKLQEEIFEIFSLIFSAPKTMLLTLLQMTQNS